MAHACNLRTQEAETGESFEVSLGNIVRPYLTKNLAKHVS